MFDIFLAIHRAPCYNGCIENAKRISLFIIQEATLMATKKQLEPVAPAADKEKALANALSQIEKQFGKGSVMRLGENTGMTVEHIPTGSIGLDLALGIGGLPRGRIIEIYGPESSVRPRSRCTALPRRRSSAARRPSSMRSTRSTRFTPRRSALTSTACWFPSRTPASRALTSQRRSSARARSTSLLSTRLPR